MPADCTFSPLYSSVVSNIQLSQSLRYDLGRHHAVTHSLLTVFLPLAVTVTAPFPELEYSKTLLSPRRCRLCRIPSVTESQSLRVRARHGLPVPKSQSLLAWTSLLKRL
jgi:hypothetical protein